MLLRSHLPAPGPRLVPGTWSRGTILAVSNCPQVVDPADPPKNRRADGTFARGVSGNPSGVRKNRDAAPRIEVPDQALVPANMDGWFSGVTGIGTGEFDKRLSHHHASVRLSYQEAVAIWASDDLGRRAIQDPVEDSFRPGWYLDIKDTGDFEDLKSSVMDRVLELQVDARVQRGLCMERAVGGSVILIGARDHRPLSAPLALSQARGVDWLTVLEPVELQPYTYYTDPSSDKYGEPETYMLTSFTTAGALSGQPVGERSAPPEHIIHASRLVVLGGIRVSKYQFFNTVAGAFWGESMLTSIYEPLRDLNVAYHAAAILMTDVGQPAISIEGLMTLVAKNPKALAARMRALEHGRSTARVVLLDAKEKLERQSGDQLSGVPELLNALAIRFAASIPMPLSRVMGQAPKALGNESDAETAFYHGDLRNMQINRICPTMRPIIQMIMQGLRKRKLPKRWSQKFNNPVQLSDAELAQARLTQARTDSMVIKSGIATPNEIRRSRYVNGYSFETEVDKTKKAPGFVAPPPHGTPGSPTNPGPGQVKHGLTQHAVTSYTRKNPASSGMEPAAKQGGDHAPGNGPNSRRDMADARTELDYVIARRAALETDGTMAVQPGAKALFGALEALARAEYQEHMAGTCDPKECLLPHYESGGERVQFAGLPVVVENPAGSTRQWVAEDGTCGSTLMRYDYGYIDGALGSDGDEVDVYLGPDEGARWVYVVHQSAPPDFEEYDEDKVMLGFPSSDAAQAAYLAQYDDERFLLAVTQMSIEVFRDKIFAQSGKVLNDSAPARQDEITEEGGMFVVRNRTGKRAFGKYRTRAEAEARLRQVEGYARRAN